MWKFAIKLEQATIKTVEKGLMTKDLAISVKKTNKVARSDYLSTSDFIDAVKDELILIA